MDKNILSIIVPVYNTEKYLDQCIESILKNTFTDFELIIVNDGSPDNSIELIRKWKSLDSRIVVIDQENQGLAGALRSGIAAASGIYIGFVDSDDYICEIDMYERLITVAIEHNADIVQTGFLRELKTGAVKRENIGYQTGWYSKSEIEKDIYPKMIHDRNTHGRGILPLRMVKIYKRDVILSVMSYYDIGLTIGEDMVLTYACMLKANSVCFIKDYYPYFYRKNPNSMVNTFSVKKYDKIDWQYKCLSRLNDISPIDLQGQVDTDFLQQYLELLDVQMLVSDSKSTIESMKAMIRNEFFKKARKNCFFNTMTTKHKLYLFLLEYKLFRLLLFIRKMKKV